MPPNLWRFLSGEYNLMTILRQLSRTILVPLQLMDILRQISNRTQVLPMGERRTLAWEPFQWKQAPVKSYILEKESGCVFKTLESWNNRVMASELYSYEK